MWHDVVIQAVLLLFFAVVIYLWFSRQYRQLSQLQAQLEKRLDYNAQQLEQSQHEVEELRAGLIGVGQRVLQLDTALTGLDRQLSAAMQELSDKQQALELAEPESKIYSRAMKMVQLGADLDEIIRECELPRAEAELLFSLHQQKKQL
jgi:predicted  nucleic acid-binding Zn-ribbon protein